MSTCGPRYLDVWQLSLPPLQVGRTRQQICCQKVGHASIGHHTTRTCLVLSLPWLVRYPVGAGTRLCPLLYLLPSPAVVPGQQPRQDGLCSSARSAGPSKARPKHAHARRVGPSTHVCVPLVGSRALKTPADFILHDQPCLVLMPS